MAEYYTPPSMEAKPLELKNKHRQIIVGFEGNVVREILSMFIYNDPKAGIRELYANAVRACLEAKKKYDADPRIEMIIDLAKMEFSIIEYDSLGITKDVFENVLSVMGRSGNFDGKLPGQFGIGLAAYLSISDTIFIESYSRNGERPSYIGREMKVFDDISDTNKVTLTRYGTKVSLKMQKVNDVQSCVENIKTGKHGEISSIYETETIKYIYNLCKFSGVKTELIIKGGEAVNIQNSSSIVGPYDAQDMLPDGKLYDWEYEYVQLDTKDFLIAGMMNSNSIHKEMRLAGMPINTSLINANNSFILDQIFTSYFINIKDERKYRPTASRDTFRATSDNEIHKDVKQALIDYAIKSDVTDVKKWIDLSSKSKKLLMRLCIPHKDVHPIITNINKFHWIFVRMCNYYQMYGKMSTANSLQSILNYSVNKAWAEEYDDSIKKFEGIVVIPPPDITYLFKENDLMPHLSDYKL